MRCKNVLTKVLIVLPLLSTAVSAFGVSFFSPGFEKDTGDTVMLVFTPDSPKLVNIKLAVQNKDNTLTAIDSSTAYNVASGSFVSARIPANTEPGINYWFIAVDTTDPTHYAALGPFPINKVFATSNPSTSLTASSTDAPYQTAGGSGSSVASTTGTPTATASGNSTPITNTMKGSNTTNRGSPTDIPNSSTDNQVQQHQSSLPISIGAIAGIAVGGVFVIVLISLLVWSCLFKKAVQVLTPTVKAALKPSNNDNESSIPMTMNPTYSPSTTASVTTPPAKTKPVPSTPSTEAQSPPPPAYTQPGPTPPTPTPATIDYSFSAGTEHTTHNNYQNNYAITSPQPQQYQGYPSYPYPYYSNQQPQGMQYLSHDSMPVPEHFTEGGQQAYPPAAMNNNYNYAFQQQQQQYPSYNPQQQQQQNWRGNYNPFGQPSTTPVDHSSFAYPAMATVAAGAESSNKTQRNNNATTVVDTPLSQKVEYDDKAEEYTRQQKPDSSVDRKSVYHKPDDAAAFTSQQHSKPHEREL